MVAIQGIGGVPDPRPQRPTEGQNASATTNAQNAPQQDGVVISSEAQAAAKIAGTIAAAADQPEIRSDRVEAARAAIENGAHRNPDIVSITADRISKLL